MNQTSKKNKLSIILLLLLISGCTPPTPAENPPTITINPTSTTMTVSPNTLQSGNSNATTQLNPGSSGEIDDNYIGVHTEGYDRYSDTDHVINNGFKWVRIQSLTDFWGVGDGLKTFNLDTIPSEVDEVISIYNNNGVNIVLDLWLGAGLTPYGEKFESQDAIDQYIDYVRFIVTNFKGRISHYQIWNEPGDISVSNYANLVNNVVPVIREIDPEAKIIIPGMHGDWNSGYPGYDDAYRFTLDLEYLNPLITSGIAPLVDGISIHPLYGNIPTDPYYQNLPKMIEDLKVLSASQGFDGKFYADEILWTNVNEGEDWPGGPPESRVIMSKYYMRAITIFRGAGVNVTINSFFLNPFMSGIHNLCDLMAGAEPVELHFTTEPDDPYMMHYAFELPDGERLLAFWLNGDAVEHDPGREITITIPGTTVQSINAIDVFQGVEQELMFDHDGENLIIENILLRDYPVFISLP